MSSCPVALASVNTRKEISLPVADDEITAIVLHVKDDPPIVAEHDQSVPTGMEASVRPVGSVSVIVIVPVLSAPPILLGAMVKIPVDDPAAKLAGLWVFAIVKSGVVTGISGKSLPAESVFVPVKSIVMIWLVVALGLLAVPPVVPAVVVPFVVPVG